MNETQDVTLDEEFIFKTDDIPFLIYPLKHDTPALNKDIAIKMGVHPNTVSKHINKLIRLGYMRKGAVLTTKGTERANKYINETEHKEHTIDTPQHNSNIICDKETKNHNEYPNDTPSANNKTTTDTQPINKEHTIDTPSKQSKAKQKDNEKLEFVLTELDRSLERLVNSLNQLSGNLDKSDNIASDFEFSKVNEYLSRNGEDNTIQWLSGERFKMAMLIAQDKTIRMDIRSHAINIEQDLQQLRRLLDDTDDSID